MTDHIPAPWVLEPRDDLIAGWNMGLSKMPQTDGRSVSNAQMEASRKLAEMSPEMLEALKAAYDVLADVCHRWPGRDTVDGQMLLCGMRAVIAKATDRTENEVSTNNMSKLVRAAIAQQTREAICANPLC